MNISILIKIILAILAFGFLIIVHELGHFIAAKKSGVRVNEFWLGMGPTIYKKKKGETEYQLRAFPIGGAVVMEGEDSDSPAPDSFGRAKIGNRALIVVAGALMNFIAGFLIIAVLFSTTEHVSTRNIESFADGFQYQGQDMLMVGDEILKIDGYRILLNSDISVAFARANNQPCDIVVKRDGQKIKLEDVPIKPDNFIVDGKEVRRYGLNFAVKPATFGDKLYISTATSYNFGRMVWYSLGDLVSGKVSVDQMSGPVGVTEILVNTAEQSIKSFFLLVAFISINLGVMNLLPLPALDGGRLIFIIIEFLRGGKKIDAKYEGFIHGAGLLVLMGFMLYVTGNDIFRLITRFRN